MTPDSFSDGGKYLDPHAALDHAEQLVGEGADMLDIGAESTRPGAAPIAIDEQVRRAIPIIQRLRDTRGPTSIIPISIDTTQPEVARAALEAGADAVNDQSAGLGEEFSTESPAARSAMFDLVAKHHAGIILMHRLRAPAADHYSHQYPKQPDYGEEGVVAHVRSFLAQRADAAVASGISPGAIVLDPGLGFGKSVEQNLSLLHELPSMQSLGHPVLCAISRKSFIGASMVGPGQPVPPPQERVSASVAAAVKACLEGVRLFRVHDVAAHRAALDSACR